MKLGLLLCPFHERDLWGMKGLSDFQSKEGVSNPGRLASECTLLDSLPFCLLRQSEGPVLLKLSIWRNYFSVRSHTAQWTQCLSGLSKEQPGLFWDRTGRSTNGLNQSPEAGVRVACSKVFSTIPVSGSIWGAPGRMVVPIENSKGSDGMRSGEANLKSWQGGRRAITCMIFHFVFLSVITVRDKFLYLKGVVRWPSR